VAEIIPLLAIMVEPSTRRMLMSAMPNVGGGIERLHFDAALQPSP
jgi:hypothetical protein